MTSTTRSETITHIKHIIIIALCAVILAAPAQAWETENARGVYLHAAVNKASDYKPGYQWGAGWDFHENLGVEVGYGSANTDYPNRVFPAENGCPQETLRSGGGKWRSSYIGLNAYYPAHEKIRIFGSAGVARGKGSHTYISPSTNSSINCNLPQAAKSTKPYAGGGIDFFVTDDIAARKVLDSDYVWVYNAGIIIHL